MSKKRATGYEPPTWLSHNLLIVIQSKRERQYIWVSSGSAPYPSESQSVATLRPCPRRAPSNRQRRCRRHRPPWRGRSRSPRLRIPARPTPTNSDGGAASLGWAPPSSSRRRRAGANPPRPLALSSRLRPGQPYRRSSSRPRDRPAISWPSWPDLASVCTDRAVTAPWLGRWPAAEELRLLNPICSGRTWPMTGWTSAPIGRWGRAATRHGALRSEETDV